MRNRNLFFPFLIILIAGLFAGCFFDHDEETGGNTGPEFVSGYHNNIIATTFSILTDEDDLSSGVTAWGDTSEINEWYCALTFNNRTFEFYYDLGYRPESPYSYATLSQEVKNQWVEVHYNGITGYCQWEDVGPWFFEDYKYVFDTSGMTRPRAEDKVGQKIDKGYFYSLAGVRDSTISTYDCNGAGIDLSPETMDYLTGVEQNHITGLRWKFVNEADALAADPMGIYWGQNVNRRPAPPKVMLNHVSVRE
ncbi:MAG: hypothetical protein C0601_08425 [Candidatus Muiribacterium halophilum]|uniref:Lipoprotein n=1 Tax=Muiribacterium halophilum TaxID=2053465 RepID=A0A2N5ZEI7_MUIH1|nr:MAG: hypothetical protein C0601_08425 [Candidatus Muirbacterium halophilum]